MIGGRRGLGRPGRRKAVAEEKRQAHMSPDEIRDWATDVRADSPRWSATADKLDAIANNIEALQQRVGELEKYNAKARAALAEALTKNRSGLKDLYVARAIGALKAATLRNDEGEGEE